MSWPPVRRAWELGACIGPAAGGCLQAGQRTQRESRCVVRAHQHVVLAQQQVQRPVAAVLDAPVRAIAMVIFIVIAAVAVAIATSMVACLCYDGWTYLCWWKCNANHPPSQALWTRFHA